MADPSDHQKRQFMRELASRHPPFTTAVRADAQLTAARRGERAVFTSRLDTLRQVIRLSWVSDAFAAQVFYRAKASLQRRGIPLLPRLFHRAAMVHGQLAIGDPVVVQPGIYILHGQVVIDGLVEIGSGVQIAPFVTIGLKAGNVQGAKVGKNAFIGTGAKIIGPVTVGAGSVVAANAVVLEDVPRGATVAGIPAKLVDDE